MVRVRTPTPLFAMMRLAKCERSVSMHASCELLWRALRDWCVHLSRRPCRRPVVGVFLGLF